MDIQYLLFLQELRNLTGGIFNEIFNGISKIAVDIIIFLPFVIYWSLDKRWGNRFLGTLTGVDLLNGVIKLSVCAYRPWIRSNLIEPAGDSKVAATGYSFPSGHSVVGTAVYGSVMTWQWNKKRWLAVLCAVALALTLFSRNFLGVHTPQDVIVGFSEAVFIIFLAGKIQKAVEGKDKLCDILTLASFFLVAAIIAYIKLKPYPMDYVNGKLLVDPQRMMNDAFTACGLFLGFTLGNYFDRHYIHYKIPFGHRYLPVLTVIGSTALFSWRSLFARHTIVAAFGGHWGNMLASFIMVFLGMTLYPVIIMRMTKEEK
ncbi:MAG: phosphatase PAP2 family protein [Spirochaetia bacterium]|nr:phosphatase PAP2 family protein [Spirochaetia bacterium]